MSADEIKEQNVWLGIDLEAAKKHLAHLREKAYRHGSLIVQYGTQLRDSPDCLQRNSEHQGNEVESLSDNYFECLDRDKTLKLADEIRRASCLVLDLETRLRHL